MIQKMYTGFYNNDKKKTNFNFNVNTVYVLVKMFYISQWFSSRTARSPGVPRE